MVDSSSVEGMRFTVHVCSEILVLLNTLGDLVLALRVSRGKTFYFCVDFHIHICISINIHSPVVVCTSGV